MIDKERAKKLRAVLKRQHYGLVGNHSGVQICRWTKKSLVDRGVCYKEKFYGINSHQCCQMSPTVGYCQNRCLHCWRAIELTLNNKMNKTKIDSPQKIIKECIQAQRKLLSGFKGNRKINLKKLREAQEPMQFAISLTGEPTLYPRLGELILELRKQGKTSFLVTNGLNPKVLERLQKNKALPTQLYVSLNAPNKELYNKWHRSKTKNAWKKFNQTLELLPKLIVRKVIRMTLVKDLNMEDEMIEDYVKLIRKTKCDFLEIKGYMSVGFARQRLGYDRMPNFEEIQNYAKKIQKELGKPYKILDSHEFSRVVLAGKSKKEMKIKKSEI